MRPQLNHNRPQAAPTGTFIAQSRAAPAASTALGGEASAPEAAKKVPTTSQFAAMYATLKDATSIAARVREVHNTLLRQPKELNSLLQVLSNKPAELYDDLFTNFKSEVIILIERLCEQGSAKNGVVQPQGHEFVIRCELHGLKKSSWAEGVEPLPNTAASLLTPKAMLKKISGVDPQGKMIRRVEMCKTVGDITAAAARLTTEGYADLVAADAQAIAFSRLVSKARRTIEIEMKSRKVEKAKEIPGTHEAVAALMAVAEELQRHQAGSSGGGARPLNKLEHFVQWSTAQGLLDNPSVAESIVEANRNTLEAQTNQLEAVVQLKSAGTDEALFDEVLRSLWNKTEQALTLTTPDILSALAVAAAAMPENVRDRVVDMLTLTAKKKLAGTQLPRRALNFIATERRRHQQPKRPREDGEEVDKQ